MKKFVIFLIFVIAFVGFYCYTYSQSKISANEIIANNNYYENLLNKEITGTELASVINRVMEHNLKNEVEKDSNGIYKSNNQNSINIEIKFKDTDNNIKAEKIYYSDIRKFIQIYSNFKFKCTEIDYHKTKFVKHLYFEEI